MGNAAASRGTRRADSVGSAGTSGAASASGAQPGGVAAAARGLSRRVSKRTRNTMRGASDASSSAGSVTSASTDEPKVKDVGYISLIRSGYNELVNAVIRPPRAKYDLDMLGPNEFTVGGVLHTREDLELVNKRGQKLVCSHWRPLHRTNPQPCMIYLHGNASCRIEALECLPLLLASGLSLFAFDFAGSGLSEGAYISLGWHERFDVEVVVGYLRESGKVSTIGLWGRSMGAATALMFGQQDPTIACMILDSPFSSLKKLIKELCETAQIAAPKFAFGLILRMIRSSVKSRAGFDMHKLSPIDFASTSYIPALFGAAEGDNFIGPHHSQDIHDQYAGDKNIVLFEGDHGSARPKFFMTSVGIWLHNTMLNHEVANAVDTQEDLLERFHTEFSFPNPLTASMEGRNARRSSSTTISAWDTEEYYPVGGGAVSEEDYYEQAMLRKVIQLSLAEAAPSAGQPKNQEEGDLPTSPRESSSKGTSSGDPSPSLRSSSSSCLVDDKVGDNVAPVPLDVELQVDDDHALVVGGISNTCNVKVSEEVKISQGETLAPAQVSGENLVSCSCPPSPESSQSLQPANSSDSQATAAQLDSQSECSMPSPPQAPSLAFPRVESSISEVDQDDLSRQIGTSETVQETPFQKVRAPGVSKNVTQVGL